MPEQPARRTDEFPRITPKQAEQGGASGIAATWLDHGRVLLSALSDDGPAEITVQVVHAAAPAGSYSTFICPLSGKLVRALYFDGQRFGGRAALGLKYRSQLTGRSDRLWARKERLLKRLEQHRLGSGAWKSAVERLRRLATDLDEVGEPTFEVRQALMFTEEALRAKRRRPQKPKQRHDLSMQAGLDRGRKTRGDLTAYGIHFLADLRAKEKLPTELPTTPLPMASALDFPEFELRKIRQGRGTPSAVRLAWQVEGREVVVLARVAWRRMRLELLISDPEAGVHQRVEVISLVKARGRDEFLMVCPSLGTHHRTLLCRNGWFASRKAQNALPPSHAGRAATPP